MIKWPEFLLQPINLWNRPYIEFLDSIEFIEPRKNRHLTMVFKDTKRLAKFLEAYENRKRN